MIHLYQGLTIKLYKEVSMTTYTKSFVHLLTITKEQEHYIALIFEIYT